MIPCFILARSASTRLPRKHFLDLGGMPMIEFVLRRAWHFSFRPILCVPEGDYDEFNGATTAIDIFEGSPDNIQTRLFECAHHYKVKVFHALDADDPYFDPLSVLDSFNAATTHRLWRVNPSYNSASGTGRMGTTYNLDAATGGDRNLMDAMSNYPWPQRLTVDYPEDYALVRMVERAVGGYMAPRAAVDELFVKNPQLYLVNWFRNDEWKMRQLHEHRSGSGVRKEVCVEDRG